MEIIRTIRILNFGGYDVLQIWKQDFDAVPGSEEVIVEVAACGVNFADIYVRQGFIPSVPVPSVLGLEAAGTVIAVGDAVQSLRVGDRVLMHTGSHGLFSEKVQISAKYCTRLPPSMEFKHAVALCVNYLTAYFTVFRVGHLAEGDTILISSAAGGVGWAATQLARTIPNLRIVGIASSQKHTEIMKNGVDKCIDSVGNIKTIVAEARKICPCGFDLIIDSYGGAVSKDLRTLLRPLGRSVMIGANSMITGETLDMAALVASTAIDPTELIMNNTGVLGFNLTTVLKDRPEAYKKALEIIFELYGSKKILPRIDSVYSFEEVVDAQKRLAGRGNIGKVILVPQKV